MSNMPQDLHSPSLPEVITALGLMGSMSNVEGHWRERLRRLALRMQHEGANPWEAADELERSLAVAAKNPQKAQLQMEYWLAHACAKLLNQHTQPMVVLPQIEFLTLWYQLTQTALAHEQTQDGWQQSPRAQQMRSALQWLDRSMQRLAAVAARQVMPLGADGLPEPAEDTAA